MLKIGGAANGGVWGVLNTCELWQSCGFGEKGQWAGFYLHGFASSLLGDRRTPPLMGTGLEVSKFIVARKLGSSALQQGAGRFVATRVAGWPSPGPCRRRLEYCSALASRPQSAPP